MPMDLPLKNLRMQSLRLTALVLVSLVVFYPVACSKGERSAGSTKAGSGNALVENPLEAARGWASKGEEGSRFVVDGTPRTYDKDSIFELLNGGADSLIDEGLTSLLHVRLKDQAAVFTDVEIQVMDFGSPQKAKAMLGKEKALDAKPLAIGDRAYKEKGSLIFVKGRHLVRVMALPLGDRRLAQVSDIARVIEATPHAAW